MRRIGESGGGTDVVNYGTEWAQGVPAPQEASFTQVEAIGSVIYEPIIGLSYNVESREWDDSLTQYPKGGSNDGAVGRAQGEIYVCGGRDDQPSPQSVVYKYTPETDSWTTVSPMPTTRYDMTTATYNGSLYIIGGQSSNNNFTDDVYRYDPDPDSWTTLQPVPIDGHRSRAVVVDDKILLAGIQTAFGEATNDTYEYDIPSDTWTQTAAIPNTVVDGGFVSVGERVIWVGGKDTNNNRFKTAYEYYPDRDVWGPFTDMPIPCSNFSGAVVGGAAYFPFGFNDIFGDLSTTQILYDSVGV